MSYKFEIGEIVIIKLTAERGMVLAKSRTAFRLEDSKDSDSNCCLSNTDNVYLIRVPNTYKTIQFYEYELSKKVYD